VKKRTASLKRKTRETDIRVELNVDGSGQSSIMTGMPFLDHMLELTARHSLIDMKIRAIGDLKVDYHHTVEDLGLTLGSALDRALGDRRGIGRYGWCLLPMDEAMSQVAVDLGGRPYLVFHMANRRRKILDFDLGLIEEFFKALVVQGRMNLHVAQVYGAEPHHAYESVFKGLGRALRAACAMDPREGRVPSSKGRI
jgi:imidazoleglycerol-phosphate dehydratase